jgi:succinate-acetate transporter protein
MNKIVSAFMGLITSLCVMAKIQIPFINWFTNVYTSEFVLIIIGGAKGIFVAILNWYAVEQVSSRYKKWKNKKGKIHK